MDVSSYNLTHYVALGSLTVLYCNFLFRHLVCVCNKLCRTPKLNIVGYKYARIDCSMHCKYGACLGTILYFVFMLKPSVLDLEKPFMSSAVERIPSG
ncbi:hypothetical protein GDO78_000016 [Eleutherodactylus coqui]|uniref:Uncharacterized protein n=1 Tax=Eleutherodactylus coqui TaxID=57060 RepID=A0A8J6FP18_ELECQ|nr:hypothetical protein GDO78_000016 [Eleutherodactylus coqui]